MDFISTTDFDLARSLECGQLFRYRKESYGVGRNKREEYVVNHRDIIFRLRQEQDRLYFSGVDRDFIINFFRLDENYRHIIKAISKDSFIRKAVRANYGLRIIRQDPWECLISYICSANNNIPRITSNVRMISKAFGRRLSDDDVDGFAFPEPGRISNHDTLKACKVGFRSRYIHEANQSVDELELLSLKRKSYAYAKAELIRLKGVGEKIADCVCMFSLDKLEAFPVDVWIRRVMLEQYFKGRDEKKITNTEIREFARKYFGRYCGYANQFLFYYRRTQPKLGKKS
jgi:N-glycosylase/DNA lyase